MSSKKAVEVKMPKKMVTAEYSLNFTDSTGDWVYACLSAEQAQQLCDELTALVYG